ncbi:MAG TPA: hypothetical protein VFS20_08170 [Longimicrobium sp.]|nr:hypothetical protein [Longimicrobium sp.]
MTLKLKLDAEALKITSFDTTTTDATRSSMLSARENAVLVSGPGCIQTRLTGPCCEDTRLC